MTSFRDTCPLGLMTDLQVEKDRPPDASKKASMATDVSHWRETFGHEHIPSFSSSQSVKGRTCDVSLQLLFPQPATFPDMAWRSCWRRCKWPSPMNWRLNRLYPAGFPLSTQRIAHCDGHCAENSQPVSGHVNDVSIQRRCRPPARFPLRRHLVPKQREHFK